jgi:hypothetical protein
MSTSTLPYAAAAAPSGSSAAPTSFWRGPFAAVTFREIGYTLTSFPIAIVGFVFAVTMFSLGAASIVAVIGLPVFALMLAGARGLGSAERSRARSKLGLEVAEPAGVPMPRKDSRWARLGARLLDGVAWRALVFQVLMFPWRVASFVLTGTLLVTGWVVALFPTYSWVFHHYVGWPGYRVFDFTSGGVRHQYYITSPLQIAAVSLLGLAIVFLTPKIVRGLTNVNRTAVRLLLG